MTVAETVAALLRIEDQNLQVYFDCPRCGKGMPMQRVSTCVLVELDDKPERAVDAAGKPRTG
jgi:hypothetical protein